VFGRVCGLALLLVALNAARLKFSVFLRTRSFVAILAVAPPSQSQSFRLAKKSTYSDTFTLTVPQKLSDFIVNAVHLQCRCFRCGCVYGKLLFIYLFNNINNQGDVCSAVVYGRAISGVHSGHLNE